MSNPEGDSSSPLASFATAGNCGKNMMSEKSCNNADQRTGDEQRIDSCDAIQTLEGAQMSPDDDFPDGGLRAWLVLIGATCNCFSTFGFVNSWGIFQAYYQENLLKGSSPSSIAWIGSIQYCLIFLPGLVVGRLFDLGYFRSVLLSCTAILISAIFLVAQCTKYWHFLLCQGFIAGLAAGGIFGSRSPILAHWFKKKRGQALGFSAMGASLGGTTIPIAAKALIPRVGFPWTMRIIGLILLATLGICNLTMKRRLPPVKVKGGLLNLKAFKDIQYTLYCVSLFITYLGLYTQLTYISTSAVQLGSSPELAFYFVAFINASSSIGRWIAGNLADITGPVNIMIPFTFFSGVLTCVWPFTHSTAALITVTVLYGFCSGVYAALLSAPAIGFGGEADVGRRVGMSMSIAALGAVAGPPISGAINAGTGGFGAVGLYAGSTIIVGALCMLIVRHMVLRRVVGRF